MKHIPVAARDEMTDYFLKVTQGKELPEPGSSHPLGDGRWVWKVLGWERKHGNVAYMLESKKPRNFTVHLVVKGNTALVTEKAGSYEWRERRKAAAAKRAKMKKAKKRK